ncbi:MAG: hypothetical protein ACHQAY_26460 [Hyphomicrobiales bacterium]
MATLARALFLIWLSASWGAAASSLNIEEPQRFEEVERGGFTFGEVVLGKPSAGADNAALYREPAYRSIVDNLAADLLQLRRSDPQLGLTMKTPHRMFDAAWLRSPAARFELVGVINRMDRDVFAPGSCGEIRFIYRLAYRKAEAAGSIYSRLPMTANVVFLLPGEADRCGALARQWSADVDLPAFGEGILSRQHLKSVEFNLQAVRWPSTVRPDWAGYAEYLLRVFHLEGDRFVLAGLENTPDVQRLSASPSLKLELIDWLKEPAHFQAIDDGIAQLPEAFLARKATSVALDGTHRLANMPFTQIFSEAELADLPYAGGRTVRSPHGLLTRLNDMSCTGCHSGRTVAGFHFLGSDRAETDAVNAVAVGASPHFLLDQPRRTAYVDALAAGARPLAARPLSVRADQGEGGFGSHCGLGDPSFASWTCRPGLRCEPVTLDDKVRRTGVCLPQTPIAGSACQAARLVSDRDPHRDRLIEPREMGCGPSAVCESAAVGFPSGMCSGGCSDLKPGETCGTIAILQGFNDCLAAGKPFVACLRDNVRPAALKACSEAVPCRDDFICARTPQGQGACIPPYFLFQLRVDGHPSPG